MRSGPCLGLGSDKAREALGIGWGRLMLWWTGAEMGVGDLRRLKRASHANDLRCPGEAGLGQVPRWVRGFGGRMGECLGIGERLS